MATSVSNLVFQPIRSAREPRQYRTRSTVSHACAVSGRVPDTCKFGNPKRSANLENLLNASIGRTQRPSQSRRCRHLVRASGDSLEAKLRVQRLGKETAARLEGSSLFFVGMMGSGKSTVGKKVAEALQYAFFDSDQVVEQAKGATVAEIFAEEGEEGFRQIESQVISELSSYKNCVVSTGGGAVIDRKNWSYMQNGVVVWLNVPVMKLVERVGQDSTRPLIDSDNEGDAGKTLNELLEERKTMYSLSDIVVQYDSAEDPALDDPDLASERVLLEIKSRVVEDDQAAKLRTDPERPDLKDVNINEFDESE